MSDSESDLATLRAAQGASGSDELVDLHDRLVESGYVGRLTRAVLGDEALTRAVAERSYRHRNGFTKIVLWQDSIRGARLRVHHWRGWPPNEPMVHDHPWDFASHVLQGTLQMKLYRISGEGLKYHAYRVGTLREAGVRELPNAGLDTLREATFAQGTTYGLPAEAIHEIVPAEVPATTIVLQGPHRRTSTTVFDTVPDRITAYPPAYLTPCELRVELQRLLRYVVD